MRGDVERLKKSHGLFCPKTQMSHTLIGDLKKKAIPVNQACSALSVSRSGDYSAAKVGVAAPKVCADSVHLKAAFADSGRTYGSRRLCTASQLRGITIGRHRLRSLMRCHKLRSIWRGKFIHTNDSEHTMAVSSNVVDMQFARALPNQAWVSDITYIRTRRGWLYLAVVLVCAALWMVIVQRNPEPKLIVHSDWGTQYASGLHQMLLARHGLLGSVSCQGDCWDNAAMELFILNLKMGRVWQKDYTNHAEAITDVADYIVNFYNTVRLHSTLGNLSSIALGYQSASQKLINVPEIT